MSRGTGAGAREMSVVWHDVECGAYSADLELWEGLSVERGRRVLELGCGTGRVGIWLARRGHWVAGLDSDRLVVERFNRRAEGLTADAREADATGFELEQSFDLVLAPMQLIQLLDGSEARKACLARSAGCLRPGGLLALALVEGSPTAGVEEFVPPVPDVREIDGWVYSSLPLETVVDGEAIVVRRLRQAVSPVGGLREEVNEIELHALSAGELEAEAIESRLRPAGRREVPETDAHVGSTVVLLEKEES